MEMQIFFVTLEKEILRKYYYIIYKSFSLY